MKFFDALKQLQSFIPAIFPYVTSTEKLPLFKDLNPSISQDLWPATSVLALVFSATIFNLARTTNKGALALTLCLAGALTALLSYFIINALSTGLLLRSDPAMADYAVQVGFVLFFVGIGCATGWTAARILK
jgi:hypothetical protein